MITGRQIRAARALLDMSQDELAKAAGLTKQGISKIEDGSVQPREGTLADIKQVFDEKGIEFTDNNGVRQKPQNMTIFEGASGFAKFYDYMHQHLNYHTGDICVSGVDERLFAKFRPEGDTHRIWMTEHAKANKTFTMKILVREGDYNFTATGYAKYKWQQKEYFSPTSFFVFGDCLALISFSHEPSPQVIVIQSASFAEAYRQSFHLAWENAIEPPPKSGRP